MTALSSYIGCELSHQEIIDNFKTFYYDTALSAYEVILAAMELDRILIGSDFPGGSHYPADELKNLDEHFRQERAKFQCIVRDNALKLFPKLRLLLEI